MANVYPEEFLKHWEIFEEQYTDMNQRNRIAREMRNDGWTVTCKKWDFTDLARAVVFSISAKRAKKGGDKP